LLITKQNNILHRKYNREYAEVHYLYICVLRFLAPPLFVEVLVHLPSQESARTWVLLLEESSLLQFLIFLLRFGNVQSAIFYFYGLECRSL